MCGLSGFLNASRNQSSDEMEELVGRMTRTLQHRGPDDAGTWCDPASGIALGFRRLSIVDLSAAGHQQESAIGSFGASTSEAAVASRQISATGRELLGTMHDVAEVAADTVRVADAGRGNYT